MGNPPPIETERGRFLRRAAEARAFVARTSPELLDTSGIDTTLHELTLALPVLERLADGYRHALSNEWLRSLQRVTPPDGR